MEQTQRPAFNAKQQSYRSDLANVLSPLFNGAITVAQLAQISDDVVDASIVYATPAAAQLFGFDHAEQLIGQYISHLHHPEDALITRHYALARIRNDWHPDPYPMRILRGTTQELVPVFKHVRQVTIDGVLTWITVPDVGPVARNTSDRLITILTLAVLLFPLADVNAQVGNPPTARVVCARPIVRPRRSSASIWRTNRFSSRAAVRR